MSIESIVTLATASFRDFCCERPSTRFSSRDLKCLAGYIQAWVTAGEGVHICQEDYQTYLIAVHGIINRWQRDPSIIDYRPVDSNAEPYGRSVDHIFMDNEASHPPILDPHFFSRQVFVERHPDRDLWWKDEPMY